MSLGLRDFIGEVQASDTAELVVYLRVNEQPVTEDQIDRVTFTVQKPDGTQSTDDGIVQSDGSGFLRWTDTTAIGLYKVRAQFALASDELRSVMTNFTVIDPFDPPQPTATEVIVDQVQLRLEDCFDSPQGGPWLRERSMAHFDFTKIADFVPEALLDINIQMPPTNFDIGYFTTSGDSHLNPNLPLLVKGVLVLTIRHLMRSYTEQPIPANTQAAWHDRTRYQQAWGALYQVEQKDYIDAVRLWKRTSLNLGHSALLISNKSGRLTPGGMRTRGVFRGYF